MRVQVIGFFLIIALLTFAWLVDSEAYKRGYANGMAAAHAEVVELIP